MARCELTRQDKMRRMGITLLIVACLCGLALAGPQVRRIDPEGNEVPEYRTSTTSTSSMVMMT